MEIKGYPDYLIYNDGRIYSKERNGNKKGGVWLKHAKDKIGYPMVSLHKNNKQLMQKVHRLVALHYIPNPNNYPQVDHINRIKDDNRVENLRWVNHSINQINRNMMKNNTTGYKNIHIKKDKRRPNLPGYYKIQIKRNKVVYEKSYKTLEDAIKQRDLMLSMWVYGLSTHQTCSHLMGV